MTRLKHGSYKSKQKISKKPLQPCVTMEQIIAFDPARPETATPSPLMNQILTAMHEVCPLSSVTLGKYLDVAPKSLTGAVKLLTGIDYAEVRERWAKGRMEILRKQHPDWKLDQLCQAVGYADHTSFWRTKHREKRREEYREQRSYSEFRTAQENSRLRKELERLQEEARQKEAEKESENGKPDGNS